MATRATIAKLEEDVETLQDELDETKEKLKKSKARGVKLNAQLKGEIEAHEQTKVSMDELAKKSKALVEYQPHSSSSPFSFVFER